MQEYYALLRRTSRTFALGIEALPHPLRDAVTLAYLALRVSDYFEDSPELSTPEKIEALGRWESALRHLSRDTPPPGTGDGIAALVHDADAELPDLQAALKAETILEGISRLPSPLRLPIVEHTTATTRGMAEWAERGADFPDEGALDDYMFEVAGRVGLLLTDLFTLHSPRVAQRRGELLAFASSFGLALQTVNVIRGLHEDPRRGWTYVPRDWIAGLAHAPVSAGPAEPALSVLDGEGRLRLVDRLVRKAARHLSDSFDYCRRLPRSEYGIRLFCTLPALLALRTAALSRNNERVFSEPVKLERSQVRRAVLTSRLLSSSNLWVTSLRSEAARLGSETEE